jgi:hypothetical protein
MKGATSPLAHAGGTESLVSEKYYIGMASTHGNTPVNTLCEVRDAVLEIMMRHLHNI